MKSNTLPVKRCPAPRGLFKRLAAVTRNRKQRVAATHSATDYEEEDSGSKISKALIIIFLIHIVAIGLIFVHQRFLDGRPQNEVTVTPKPKAAPVQESRLDLPSLASGEKPYIVKVGDNYTRIALAEGVDEADLRLLNKHVDIRPGLVLKVPPMRIVAIEPDEVTALRASAATSSDEGLVDVATTATSPPRATVVQPNDRLVASVSPPQAVAPVARPVASGRSYIVQSGDSIWRIAKRFKVDQNQLMKLNGITDPRKVRTGMNLIIPR